MLTNTIAQIYSGSKVIGRVKGDTFLKSIKGSKHMLRKPPAIAISIDALDQAQAAGAVRVKVTDQESGTTYTATIEHLREDGFEFDRGYGPQIGLVLDGWSRTLRGRQFTEQLNLFEGARR
jgi:hypothetical protein